MAVYVIDTVEPKNAAFNDVVEAEHVGYDNSDSGLDATTVQAAIDEIVDEGGGGGGGDASDITYTPSTLANWNSGADPGDVDNALDQLAANLSPMLPPSAPVLDYISYTGSTGVAGKNTWNENDNPIATYANAPADSVINAADAVDITMVTTGTGKGVYDYDSFSYVLGTLNDDVTAHAYSYPADSFSPGGSDGGTQNDLILLVNGSAIHTTDLLTFASGNDVNGNSSGFYSLSAATPVKFSDASNFTPRTYRTGAWRVYKADLSRGHNTIKTQHTTDSGTTTCTVWEFLLDDDDTDTSYSSESISGYNADASTKNLSGVKYTTGTRTATYNVTIDNAYKNTYSVSSSAVNYTGTNCTITDEALAVSGGDETKQVVKAATLTLSASPAYLVNATVSVSTTVDRTVQSEAASGGASLSGVLWDNVSANSTALIEYFTDENYRIQNDEDFNTDLSATWDEAGSLVGADAGYNTGLQCVSGKLDYPTVDYSSLTNGPSSNVDYSGASGTRYYFRYFTSGTGASNFRITTSSSAVNSFTWISKDDALGTANNNVRISLRWPTQTGWLDTKTAFIEGQFGATDDTALEAASAGCYSSGLGSDFTPAACSVGITCGSKTTSNSYDNVYMRIEVGEGWTGSIDDITFVWGAT
jgi:hypothetical protein